MDTIPKIILQNPFRVLGVYANSKRQEILANKSRANAFLSVNRPVEYPLDLNGILPPLSRTLDMMNEAEAHLAIAKEQIKYAQFWFLQKMSPLDDVAFNHLIAGDMAGAKEIWSRQESQSSLQNKLVCCLIEDNIGQALNLAERLYEKFGDIYINKVDANCTLQMTGTELLHQFIDSLGEEVGMQKLLGYELGMETKGYISSKTIGPLINMISAEVERAKRVNHKDPKARLDAARNLVRNTKDSFAQLKQLLPADDPQFVMIADKLGLEILQCGIDYFNNSDEDGRHQKAMKVQRYAQSVVVGTLAKQRCDENVNILQGLIDKLPPEEVKKEQEHLLQLIALFTMFPANVDGVLKFLKDTCSDLVAIKNQLGKSNNFYIQQVTLVAQVALSKSIDALNEVQDKELPKLNGINRSTAIEKMSHAFAASWKAMLWIELMETDIDFKTSRLLPNKKALKNILDQVDAFKETHVLSRMFGGSYSVFEGCAKDVKVDKYVYYTEDELFGICKTIPVCEEYIKKFPRGNHIQNVRKKLSQLKDDQLFTKAKSLSDLHDYLTAYPRGRHVQEAKERIEQIEEEKRKKREQEIKDLIRQISNCKNTQSCIALLDKCKKYNSKELNTELDERFFSLCNSTDNYNQYLKLFGYSAVHQEEVKKIISRRKFIKRIVVALICIAAIVLFGYIISYVRKEQEQRKAVRIELMNKNFNQACLTMEIDSCMRFLADYPDCPPEMRDSVRAILNVAIGEKADSLVINNASEEELKDFYYSCLNISGVDTEEAIGKIRTKWEEIEQEKEREEQRKAEEAKRTREKEEQEKYGTDARAWKTATSIGSIAAYYDYLKRYPNGKHVDDANKRIIDLEVQAVVSSGDYGHLPPSQKMSYTTSSTSSVHIRNSSSSTITILYSGPKSLRIVLSPSQSRTVVLPSSNYKVVATAPGVRSFYGTESLTGGDYESEYYITTSRY